MSKKSTIALSSSTLISLKQVKELYGYNSYEELLSFILEFIIMTRISKEDLIKLNVMNEIKNSNFNDFERIIKIIKNIEKNLLIPTNNTVQKLYFSNPISNEIVEDNSKINQLEKQIKLKDSLINNLKIDEKIKDEKIMNYAKILNLINSNIEKEDDLFNNPKNYIIKVSINEFDKLNNL